jgi:mono/diheme cytochrome c family protein
VAGAIFFFGGFFNIAASQPDPDIVNWALVKVRMASISRHADTNSPVDPENADIVHAGARAFAARGCANCHGAPGVNWQKFSEGLQPDPPDLKDVVKEREPRELFWVVKNGIKMTAMPSFGAIGAEDNEIWSIVAFLRKLPTVSESDYKEWTTP